MDLHAFISYPITKGAIAGIVSAAAVDIAAFRAWKDVHEAMEYGWGIAAWRWFQGAVLGALTAAGLGAI